METMCINLRGLWSTRRSSTVAPLPENHHQQQQQHLFDDLKHGDQLTGVDLLHNVAESVKEQKMVSRSVSDPNNSGLYGRDSIEEYLESDAELLDVCNSLLAKIESVRRYGHSVKRAVSLVSTGTGTRVKFCKVDGVGVEKAWSRLKRLVVKEKRRRREGKGESLTSSLSHVVSTCRSLDKALSCKKRRGSGAGASTGQMVEMRDVMVLVNRMRDRTAEIDVENVKKKCDELVEVVGPLEEIVKELYSQLVAIRLALLGILSSQC